MDSNLVIGKKKETAKLWGQHLILSKVTPITDFRQSFIQYLRKNVSGRILFKLMKLNKYFIPSKFKLGGDNCSHSWNTGGLIMTKSNNLNLFFQKSLFCDLNNIKIVDKVLKFEELKHLVTGGNLKSLFLQNVTVLDDCGKTALIDDIIDLTPKLEELYLVGKQTFSHICGGVIARKLIQTNLKCIRFFYIPESFDFQTFAEIIQGKGSVQIQFWFHESISDDVNAERIKERCPFEYIRSWYYGRHETDEERAAQYRP